MIKMTASDLANVITSLLSYERSSCNQQEYINRLDIMDELDAIKRSISSSDGKKVIDKMFDINDDDVQF